MSSCPFCQDVIEKKVVKVCQYVYNVDMKTIDNDIKTGQFKQIYLLYGEEQYLIRQYRDKLKHALAADDDTMNFSAFSGSDINQKEIIDLAETLPFFADRRLILIEDSGLFKKVPKNLPITCLPFRKPLILSLRKKK